MLELTISGGELWSEKDQTFINMKETTIQLEHSLVSLSKWESKWHKPFFSKKDKTYEETIDYIRTMTLNKKVDPIVYYCIKDDDFDKIHKYIEDSMTATTVYDDDPKKINNEVVTSELIYYWMIALGIPFECQKWHLNRLIMLIKVCNAKNAPQKKSSPEALAKKYAEMNKARRKKFNTKG